MACCVIVFVADNAKLLCVSHGKRKEQRGGHLSVPTFQQLLRQSLCMLHACNSHACIFSSSLSLSLSLSRARALSLSLSLFVPPLLDLMSTMQIKHTCYY